MIQRLKYLARFILISLSLLGLSVSSVNAVTLNVVGGQLMGADNVDVNGSLYDVDFMDGSCISLFDGCDESADFTFFNDSDALAASQALLDQVLLDTPQGDFDSEPQLTNGCSGDGLCQIVTPFGLDGAGVALLAEARNYAPGVFTDRSDFTSTPADTNTGVFFGATYAIWAPVSPVPIPAAVWLFGTALVGLIGFGRRKSEHLV